MHENPFSPSFSIRPSRFYGRRDELALLERAIDNPDSADRFLFLTGTRGCGKTSLIHQFALIGKRHKWTVLETTYQDALDSLRQFAKADADADGMVKISPSVSAGGVSASLFEAARTTKKGSAHHLAAPLVAELSKRRYEGGLLVTIDEIQKIAESDMEEICHAVQGAKTAGHNIALVIAGLPEAYAKVRGFRGCTFVQRMRHYQLGMMHVAETTGFLRSAFARVPEIVLSEDQIVELARFSSGHPYLLQLLGNATYEIARENMGVGKGERVVIDSQGIREAQRRAFEDYKENILRTLLVNTRKGTKEFLRAMCDVCDDQSTARTLDIARRLGKTMQECSATRSRVIELQLVYPVARGVLRFALPYFPLAFEFEEEPAPLDRADAWIPPAKPF